jgi:hypothetical protein
MKINQRTGADMNNLKFILIPAVILLIALCAGCGKDDDNPAGPQNNVPAELLGTWYYQSATINGVQVPLGFVLGWDQGTVSARFTVGADESFVYEELNAADSVVWTESGTFTVDGNNATITITQNDDGPVEPPDVLSGTWSFDEASDRLTLNTIYSSIIAVRNL